SRRSELATAGAFTLTLATCTDLALPGAVAVTVGVTHAFAVALGVAIQGASALAGAFTLTAGFEFTQAFAGSFACERRRRAGAGEIAFALTAHYRRVSHALTTTLYRRSAGGCLGLALGFGLQRGIGTDGATRGRVVERNTAVDVAGELCVAGEHRIGHHIDARVS